MLIRTSRGWEIPESEATDERFAVSRRAFVAALGSAAAFACSKGAPSWTKDANGRTLQSTIPKQSPPYPVPVNRRFLVDRPVTDELWAASYNNFFEFSNTKDGVWRTSDKFVVRPWTVEVTGLVHKPRTFDVDELTRIMPMEERLYRLRCVERWAMAVPWSGFPLASLLRLVEPTSQARFVKFVSFQRPQQTPYAYENPHFPWPYHEGLRLDEAMNELTFIATGIYGHALPKQHGAPVRLVVPWKYGYKSAKSIVRVELTDEEPASFWSTISPAEYPFESNVNPDKPHPRWSQSHERLLGDKLEVRKTQLYNGYGRFVAHLYRRAT